MPSDDSLIYTARSNNIEVSVASIHLGEQTLDNNNYYVWAYTVTVGNFNDYGIKLLKRHWKIINCKGLLTELSGFGVLGEQPIIKPKEVFNYTSGTYLTVPSGVMLGHYEFLNQNDEEKTIIAQIPMFSLDIPYRKEKPN